MTGPQPTWRISHIALDEDTILWSNADVEQERRVAIFDLIEENTFKPCRPAAAGHNGPYHLRLSVQDGRLALDIRNEADEPLEVLLLGLAIDTGLGVQYGVFLYAFFVLAYWKWLHDKPAMADKF